MKKAVYSIMIGILFFGTSAYSETFPEFVGNYIQCDTGWCEFEEYRLNAMLLSEKDDSGITFATYSGLFAITNEITLKNKKPRILLYAGHTNANPNTTALVKLERLPYNNAKIGRIDATDYDDKISYCAENVTTPLWTFKKEIYLRFKPVEGKIGAFIYEPAEPLEDGFYAIDFGTPTANGHTYLSTQRSVNSFYAFRHVQKILPFVIGKVPMDTMMSEPKKLNDEYKNTSNNGQPHEKIIEKTMNNFFNNLLNK